jgi:transposase
MHPTENAAAYQAMLDRNREWAAANYEERVAMLVAYLPEEWTPEQDIADAFGVAKATVRRLLRDAKSQGLVDFDTPADFNAWRRLAKLTHAEVVPTQLPEFDRDAAKPIIMAYLSAAPRTVGEIANEMRKHFNVPTSSARKPAYQAVYRWHRHGLLRLDNENRYSPAFMEDRMNKPAAIIIPTETDWKDTNPPARPRAIDRDMLLELRARSLELAEQTQIALAALDNVALLAGKIGLVQ